MEDTELDFMQVRRHLLSSVALERLLKLSNNNQTKDGETFRFGYGPTRDCFGPMTD